MKYLLTLSDKNDLERICKLFEKYAEIMRLLNADSKKSAKGGAMVYYEVKIEFKEIWT